MARLRWTKDRIRFTDHSRNFVTDGPGEYDVPDDAEEEYLSHRSDGWEQVDGETESGSESEETPADDSQEETSDGYTREDLESMEWSELRDLAAESDRDDINGRSSKDAIVEALADG